MQQFPFRTLAVTGGIGAGKSHVCQILADAGYPVFYADPEAKRIIRTHPEVHRELTALVGSEVYDAEGRLQKSVLAAFLCRGTESSHRVDEIVHPRVAEAWQAFVADQSPLVPLVVMECALLFESGFDRLVDRSLLVECPDEERIRRVMARDSIDRATTLRWMALQMPEAEKRRRASFTLLNDGHADVRHQLEELLGHQTR